MIKGLAPVAFSLVCGVLMIVTAWYKRGAPAGSAPHSTLECFIQLLVVLVMIGISVAGAAARRPVRGGES